MDKIKYYNIIDYITENTKYKAYVKIKIEHSELERISNNRIQQSTNIEEIDINIKLYSENKVSQVKINSLDEDTIIQALRNAEKAFEFLPTIDEDYNLMEEPIIEIEGINQKTEEYNHQKRTSIIMEQIKNLPKDYKLYGAFILKREYIIIGNSEKNKRYSSSNFLDYKIIVENEYGRTGIANYIGKGEIKDIEKSFEKALKKATEQCKIKTIDPKEYTVILEPMAFGGLLNKISDIIFNSNKYIRNSSFTAGKIGEKIFSTNLTIKDDVFDYNMLGLKIDDEGNVKQKLQIVDNGILKGVATNNKDAKTLGLEKSTGHAISGLKGGYCSNLIVDKGSKSIEEIINNTEYGILVTKFHYLNVVDYKDGILTGITRDGTFLIENGKIKSGIKDMRFTYSMREAFENISDISEERELVPCISGESYLPYIVIPNFKFVSED